MKYRPLYYCLITSVLAFCANYSLSYAFDCNTAVNITVPVAECQALDDLYTSTNGSGWTVSTNRHTDTNVCTWYGISCQVFSGQPRVVSIGTTGSWYNGSLSNNNLVGSLPASLSALTKLKVLVLSFNNLQGILSPLFSSRSNIEYIDLSSNRFTGALSSSFSSRSNIEYIDLSYNNLQGILSPSFSSRLHIKEIDLTMNNFTGSIPASLGNRTNLELFNIGFNNFNDVLSPSLSNRSSIKHVYLGSNSFTGSLPSVFSAWTAIRTFNASYNNFNGILPSSFSSRSLINTFDIRNNNFNGILPSSRGVRSSIRYFWLSNNNIDGLLPPSRGGRTNIEHLWIDNNQIAGPVPSSRSMGMTGNPYLYLRNNCLQTSGYTVTMQTRLATNAILIPQNVCTHTVTYTAATGGVISGTAVQNLIYGQTGTAVAAIPNRGCVFSGWSDGSFNNPRTDTGSINNISFTAIFSCNTVPVNASGVAVPAISFWQGKVNQHFDTTTMSRQTDPTGTRGGGSSTQWGANGWGDRPLAYCRIFWPATISVASINTTVTINTRMKMGNTMPYYSSTRKAYRCVQSLLPNGNSLPNRYSNPTIVPKTRDVLSVVNTISSVIVPSLPQDTDTVSPSIQQSSPADITVVPVSEVIKDISIDNKPLVDPLPLLREEPPIVSDLSVVSSDKESLPPIDRVDEKIATDSIPNIETKKVLQDDGVMKKNNK